MVWLEAAIGVMFVIDLMMFSAGLFKYRPVRFGSLHFALPHGDSIVLNGRPCSVRN